MTMHKAILLLWVIGTVALPNQQEESKVTANLHCYTCYVENTSMEDCDMNAKVRACPKDHDEVCVTATVIKWVKNNTETLTQYTKHCAGADYCKDNECKEHSFNCKIKCCNKDLCNGASADTTVILNMVLPAVILCLQALVLSHGF